MDKKEHEGHRRRIRERVRRTGLDSFQGYQALEYVLTFVMPYKDTNVLAHQLISRFGSFSGVLEADEEDLATVPGVGEVTAHYLSNLVRMFNYYERDKVENKVTILNPGQGYEFVKKFLNNKFVEELYLICITPKNKIASVEKIAEGSSSEASVNIRSIIEKMGRAKVSSIIIAHNHPQGESKPSAEDNSFTKALVTSLSINGCHLLDHIIIGEDSSDYYSYRKTGQIDKYKEEASVLVNYRTIAQPCAKYEVDND